MSYQAIGRGSIANDGTGDDLRTGAQKINNNFVEIYTLLGNSTDLTTDSVVLANTNQTITNKTIDSTNNSIRIDISELTDFTGTLSDFNSALTDENFVSLSGSEILTNKTISASNNTLTVSINDLTDVMTSGTMNAIDHVPSDGQVLTWDASMNHWMPKDTTEGLATVSEDLNPSLGGDLNTAGNNIISSPNVDISIQPGTGGEVDFGSNIIKYSNMVSQESDLANYNPTTYHGMIMHVHSTGALYYAHNGQWNKILTDVSNGPVENYTSPSSTLIFTTLIADGTSYRFSGSGIQSTTNNPDFVVYRGFTYIWDNSAFDDGLGGGHPFVIKFSELGNPYTEGITTLSTGITKFVVPMTLPNDDANLVYESSNASVMSGNIYII